MFLHPADKNGDESKECKALKGKVRRLSSLPMCSTSAPLSARRPCNLLGATSPSLVHTLWQL